tara:strand:- start:869 stop:1069 length:201 start_codon:yes stop_codon:yes gene_type:complete
MDTISNLVKLFYSKVEIFSQDCVTLGSNSDHNVKIELGYAGGLKLFRDIWHLGDSRHASIRENENP